MGSQGLDTGSTSYITDEFRFFNSSTLSDNIKEKSG